ncbi:MAG: hypothetical protein R3E87_15075 [Burkholderiaceae bacterium]
MLTQSTTGGQLDIGAVAYAARYTWENSGRMLFASTRSHAGTEECFPLD